MATEASVRHLNGATLTVTGQAYTGQGELKRVILHTETAGGIVAILYDAAAEGTTNQLATVSVDVDDTGELSGAKSFEIGREFENGVSVVLTGTGVCAIVFG